MSLSLDQEFEKYFELASEIPQSEVPQDIQLILYGLYKHATSDLLDFKKNHDIQRDIISAFKLNAWIQVKNLTIDEAKQRYIETVSKLIN